jgi:hypothetical protein
MPGPRIAIIGSFDPAREQELGLKNLKLAATAGEDLGRELAKQGFQIVAYSSMPYQLEVDVVRGYVSKAEKEAGSIQVMYSQRQAEPSFTADQSSDERFELLPDFNPDWESSFYQSLATVDGVIILGGGPSALIAGLVAIGHKKPVVACAGFGGSGEKVWRALREQRYPLERSEFASMAVGAWSPELAARLVSLLTRQRDGFARMVQEMADQEERRLAELRRKEYAENATINWHALISAALFILAAASWPFAAYQQTTNLTEVLVLVLLTPMVAGASGSTIRVVLDWAGGVDRTFALSAYNQYILLRFASLGIIAGGLAGVSFVLAQLFATEQTNTDLLAAALKRLIPFLMIIGFAAGLGAEVVLTNIRKTGTPTVEIPQPKSKP